MAEHQLAHRHERKAQSSLCRHPCAHRRRTTTANQGQGPATSARGGSLAHRRTQGVGREEILSRQPAGKDRPAHLGGYHQGAMDLRTGSPTAEGRTRSRSLRGTILARPSPPCAHDDDRVRLPPASPPCNCKAGKKESTGHRPSRPCQPCATPSSNSSLDHRRSDARIAENGFATSSGGSKSAKVVLGCGLAPSPPAEQTAACQDQAGQARTSDWSRNVRDGNGGNVIKCKCLEIGGVKSLF